MVFVFLIRPGRIIEAFSVGTKSGVRLETGPTTTPDPIRKSHPWKSGVATRQVRVLKASDIKSHRDCYDCYLPPAKLDPPLATSNSDC